MQGRDLLRRRGALALLVALPLAFYLSQLGGADAGADALVAGGVGTAWVAAGAALFCTLASRRVDPRLVLAGYRPAEIVVGRLLLLQGAALALAGVFAGLMAVLSRPARPVALLVALAATGLIAVPLGLAIASVMPRDLEATMALIGVVGIEMAIQPPSPLLPLYGPLRLMAVAAGGAGGTTEPVLHAVAAAGMFFAVALVLWARRLPIPLAGQLPETT